MFIQKEKAIFRLLERSCSDCNFQRIHHPIMRVGLDYDRAWVALRAGAGMFFCPRWPVTWPGFFSGDGIHRVYHNIDLWPDYPIEDIPAVPTVFNQPCISQHHEMLRYMGLAQAKRGLHVTDTLLAVP
jgi:hypothetical protein